MSTKSKSPEFSFCESIWAQGRPWALWHIRKVGSEGLKFGGGATEPLCWSEGHSQKFTGCDLDADITPHHLQYDTCSRCLEKYQELMKNR